MASKYCTAISQLFLNWVVDFGCQQRGIFNCCVVLCITPKKAGICQRTWPLNKWVYYIDIVLAVGSGAYIIFLDNGGTITWTVVVSHLSFLLQILQAFSDLANALNLCNFVQFLLFRMFKANTQIFRATDFLDLWMTTSYLYAGVHKNVTKNLCITRLKFVFVRMWNKDKNLHLKNNDERPFKVG